MQILYVLMITILNLIVISNIGDIRVFKAKSEKISRDNYQKVEIADAISQNVKLAYDLGQLATPGCLAGTSARQVSSLNNLPAPIKLCWVNLDANNCFTRPYTKYRLRVCIANTQTLTQNFNNLNLINLVSSTAHAMGGGDPGGGEGGGGGLPGFGGGGLPGAQNPVAPIGEGNINDDNYNNSNYNLQPLRVYNRAATHGPVPNPAIGNRVFSADRAGARITLPVEDPATNITSNFINCQRPHTECFSITFCTNGSNSCNGKNRFTQTFGVRHY